MGGLRRKLSGKDERGGKKLGVGWMHMFFTYCVIDECC